ncbi:MAG: endonuclease [Thermoplasmata archaeon]|nr:MAG: endonuclease [Thermoplasmata archaeon]
MSEIDLYEVYRLLFKKFGSQGWWPTTAPGEAKPKHRGKKPDTEKEKLEIVIGAILTQNTSWKNVERAIENLNRNNLMDIDALNLVDTKHLAQVIKPAGYYNQKAERIKNFIRFLLEEFDGSFSKLFSMNLTDLRNKLLSLKGIGKETADSIILYAALKPIFVVDAYTKRIAERIGLGKKDYNELQKIFMESLPENQKIFAEYHALLVRLGKEYCKKNNPRCRDCPLKNLCSYAKVNLS